MDKFGSIKALAQMVWKSDRLTLLIIIIKNIFSACIPLINIAVMGFIIDALMTGKSMDVVVHIITLYVLVSVIISLTQNTLAYFGYVILRKSSDKFQFDYMKDAVFINYHYVQDGTIFDLRQKSMGANPAFSLDHVGDFVNYIIKFAGIIYVFSILSPFFIIMISVTSFISIIFSFRIRKLDYDLANKRVTDDRKLDYLYRVMVRYEYAKDIRINDADKFVLGKYKKIFVRQMLMITDFFGRKLKTNVFISIITVLQSVMMHVYFSYQVFSGTVTIAEYLVLLASVTLLTTIILGFFDKAALLGRILDRTKIFLEYKSIVRRNSDISDTNHLPLCDKDFSRFTICFDHVSFTYPDGKEPVLNDIDLMIRNNEKIGIVGLNGSGKTTLIKLLLRIYTPTLGKITVNGIDIQSIPLSQYIKMIGVVLQDYSIFAYTLKDNIIFDSPLNKVKLSDSIQKSGLKEKVDKLPKGLDTVLYKELDDSGIELSSGEAQKLALARAMYKEPRLLILDEPTSHLDPIAEHELFLKISDLAGSRTAIFISHRLSSTRFCDRIIVLDDGSIIEEGMHDELMEKDGFYAKLFTGQAKHYRDGVK